MTASLQIPAALLELPPDKGALVALVGPPGSGKSTFAAALVKQVARPVSVLCLDEYRARVSAWGDEADQYVTPWAVANLHIDLDEHLAQRRLVVVDATNAESPHRRQLLEIAARHGAVTAAAVLLPALGVCQAHNAQRDPTVGACGWARQVPAVKVADMHAAITGDLPHLADEGWAPVVLADHARAAETR
ncbi:AAA family ATPase [Saccharopolyspora taberi]|uniref:AAA+ ATPase domain-containing protein n=1 Tax=Saccharopolyspora taberi TaxID=60895 RepID=A0ABN3VEY2_9PSEU